MASDNNDNQPSTFEEAFADVQVDNNHDDVSRIVDPEGLEEESRRRYNSN
jgi:hypothetical protein